ncbi:MAG: DUF5698 domain-containing protein [Acidimicrobiia bacterium]|nr:DUF5698 domain-containing protein [Acidimicrobiia bacterium]
MQLAADLFFIFFLRAIDVGIATVRIVLLGRGRRTTAAALGFFESLIWVIAVSRVLSGLDDPWRMVAFAAGFAAGTYVGSLVEEWLAIGQSLLRVVAPIETDEVAPLLREKGFGATVFNGGGMEGDVRLTLAVIPRRKVGAAVALIQQSNPEAFVTIDQTASVDLRHERDVRK